MSTCYCHLHFLKGPGASLFRTECRTTVLDQQYRCVRGKTEGAFQAHGTFQWSAAVLGMSVLFLRTHLSLSSSTQDPHILGDAGTPAASLDYAISKQPHWLSEMFGADRWGTCVAKRLFLRTNPNRKRIGPVILSINCRILPAASIKIFVDNERPATQQEVKDILASLESQVASRIARGSEVEVEEKIVVNG